MATVIAMRWQGVTPEQYEGVLQELDLDDNPADGGIFHVAGFSGDVMYVTDVWDSQEHFGQFQEERLAPAVQKVGIQTEPKLVTYEAHNIYAPAGERVAQMGATALPA